MTRLMSMSDLNTLHHWGLATSPNKHASGLPQPTNAKTQTHPPTHTHTHTKKQQRHKARRQQVQASSTPLKRPLADGHGINH
ncbi:hypothetical protein N7527_009278 [Penicillium freii]|nr:hypothetical protein N7527_009278 [Penicillium freii]